MKAYRLRTERLYSPIGIDERTPLLSWLDEGLGFQKSYRVECYRNSELIWSHEEESSKMNVRYSGPSLNSRDIVSWRVSLRDDKEWGEWSDFSSFEMGLLDKADWKAKWIMGDYKPQKNVSHAVDCFKKEIKVKSGIKKARLYATASGVYKAYINGCEVGDFYMAPGHTDYRKRIYYQTYDVTSMLKSGNNTIYLDLADGWYRGSCGAWGLKNQYGVETKFILQLEVENEKGEMETFISDSSWLWSNDGSIKEADNKDGEVVDANLTPSYSKKAKETEYPLCPISSNSVRVVKKEEFTPTKSKAPDGATLFDFGQNIAGIIELDFEAKGGEELTITCGELLDKDGNLTLKNIQCSNKKKTTPLQRIKYKAKKGRNQWSMCFSVFGFQYAEVRGDIELKESEIKAIAVYSDLERTGWFESSNILLNKFVEATVWSTKGNSLDIPTDCPTRERHGWTGDAQIFYNTASYLFDYNTFSKKYIADVFDWQKKDGKLPQIAPYGGVDFYMSSMDGSVGWSDVGVLIPYRQWKKYGDDSLIKKYYINMKKYALFMINRCNKFTPLRHKVKIRGKAKKYLVNYGQSYGEWAEPEEVFPNHWTNVILPHPEESTAYTSFIMSHMIEIAEYLGKTEDIALYKEYRDGCREAYKELVHLPSYSLDTDRQAKLVRPLYMHLLDEKDEKYAKERLIKALEDYGWRLGTGFLSTPFILYVLSDINVEYAYKLLENEEMPGWLYMTKNGANTIWESWEGTSAQSGIASLNHYSKGAVVEWLFDSMCGIRIKGENEFDIFPKPGGNFSYAKAKYNSEYGTVESGWEKKNGKVIYHIGVPCNTKAYLKLPKGGEEILTSGDYVFEENA